MEKVTGIGGLFFRSRNQAAMREWYATHLGIDPTPTDYDTPCWRSNGGPTVFEPFAHDTDYFGAKTQQWMINFRVRDLDAMMQQLRDAGIDVTFEGNEPNGRFALLKDPEGNPIQLWEPSGPSRAAEEPL